MDRYMMVPFIDTSREPQFEPIEQPDGEWVKYSDVESLQARVRELEGCMKALRGITRAMPYSEKVKQAQGVIDQALQLITKGTP